MFGWNHQLAPVCRRRRRPSFQASERTAAGATPSSALLLRLLYRDVLLRFERLMLGWARAGGGARGGRGGGRVTSLFVVVL